MKETFHPFREFDLELEPLVSLESVHAVLTHDWLQYYIVRKKNTSAVCQNQAKTELKSILLS